MKETKTIFIAISRGLVCRNLLRTGVLKRLLEDPNVRVVILFPKHGEGIPPYLRQEFASERVILEEIAPFEDGPLTLRFWLPLINNLVYESVTDMLAREGSGKVKPVPTWWYPFHKRLFSCLSKSSSLKAFTRWLDRIMLRVTVYDKLFRQYQPDVLFVGSIISKYDLNILKAATRHRVPAVGMQKGWDNLQRQLIRAVPDRFLVQNPRMIEAATSVQMIPETTMGVAGFPQFDLYQHPEEMEDRETFCRSLGVDPSTKIFLFGSEGLWTPQDDRLIDALLEMRASGAFPFPTLFIARPHFSDISKHRYERFRGREGIIVDDEYRFGTYFFDSWDPSKSDMRHFASELRHMSALVCYASTLSLDAACFDKPIINITFGSYFPKEGQDLTSNLYRMDHYEPVLASGGVELVHTLEELKLAVIRSVENPLFAAAGRKRLLETMCGPQDGQSAKRIAETLLSFAYDSR